MAVSVVDYDVDDVAEDVYTEYAGYYSMDYVVGYWATLCCSLHALELKPMQAHD